MLDFVLGILLARIVLSGRKLPLDFPAAVVLAMVVYLLTPFIPPTFGIVAAMTVPLGLLIAAGAGSRHDAGPARCRATTVRRGSPVVCGRAWTGTAPVERRAVRGVSDSGRRPGRPAGRPAAGARPRPCGWSRGSARGRPVGSLRNHDEAGSGKGRPSAVAEQEPLLRRIRCGGGARPRCSRPGPARPRRAPRRPGRSSSA